MFNENSETAIQIIDWICTAMVVLSVKYKISYKHSYDDIARRFLNEIVEFEPMEKEKRSSLRPWETE